MDRGCIRLDAGFGRAWLCAALLGLISCGCAFAPADASAAVGQFGAEGQGAGQFKAPEGIAVDNGDPLTDPSAGAVYVVDRFNNRVDKFGREGDFLLAWGWGVVDGKAQFETCGPEAEPPTDTCERGLAGGGAGELELPGGVAVDDDPLSASFGDVDVEDLRNHRIDKFSPDGHFLLAWGEGVANGEEEAQMCGPEAVPATTTCQAAVEPKVEGEGEGPGEFERMLANTIAVDSAGTVYVGGNERVQEFNDDGVFAKQVALNGVGFIGGLAVDSAKDLYVLAEGSGFSGVHKYNQSHVELGAPRDPSAKAFNSVIALGPAGELFVSDSENHHIAEYESGGVQVTSFGIMGEEAARGLAFGESTDRLYALGDRRVRLLSAPPVGPLIEDEEAVAEPVGTATVKASIDPEGKQTSYEVEYGVEGSSETATAPVTMTAEGFEPETVEVKLTGLVPGERYAFHFVASNENAPAGNAGADETFATLPAVAIESESVAQVTATSARLAAVIDPLTLPSEYHFEYLSEGEFVANGDTFSGPDKPVSAPQPDGYAGSGDTGVPESIFVEGLTAGTTYRYRVVAHNECEPVAHPHRPCVVEGADGTFTTQAGVGEGLIDGRGWEMVSPTDKHGAALEAITAEGGDIQASADGSRLAYIALAPATGEAAGSTSSESQELLSIRGGGVWSTQDIATPNEAVGRLGGKGLSEYKLFSPDLSAAIVEPEDDTLLSSSTSERTPYVRQPGGEYMPLVTGCPPVTERCLSAVKEHEDVPPGTKFGPPEPEGRTVPGTGVEFDTATPDLSHVVLNAPQSLTAGFEAGGGQALYEWAGGELRPVSLLEGGESAGAQDGAALGDAGENVRNAISANGERVFFETGEHHLYMRDVAKQASAQLDKSEPGVAVPLSGAAVFQDASSEGERVFFTDKERLTSNSGVESESGGQTGPDLYECEIVEGAGGEPECRLSDLTPLGLGGEPANVQGLVIGASEDGQYVYFVANGILTSEGAPVPGAVRGNCQLPLGTLPSPSASCNLYVWHDGVTRLVSVLSNRDFPEWAPERGLTRLTARVSPDGRYLAFMSQRSLTGYDNDDAHSGEPDEEMYLYHAPGDLTSEPGALICASCDPSGARPNGLLEPSSITSLLVDRPSTWAEQWVAASVPGWTATGDVALYQSRYLSDVGRLFFDSPADLVSAATNEKEDVYEFEPEGVGSCTSSTSSASAVYVSELDHSPVGGCVGLISSGTSSEESAFLDASESGEDVFFLTAAKLAGQDTDDALDVYDAHVCSPSSPCPAGTITVPPACTTAESCRAAPAARPEVFGAPASATLAGPGNLVSPAAVVKPKVKPLTRAQKLTAALKVCRVKRKRRTRVICEKQARHRYSARAKKSTNKTSVRGRKATRSSGRAKS